MTSANRKVSPRSLTQAHGTMCACVTTLVALGHVDRPCGMHVYTTDIPQTWLTPHHISYHSLISTADLAHPFISTAAYSFYKL